jgi:2-iminobutanoate/2-iminopropanoate deaminase
MSKRQVASQDAPKAIGPYSQAIAIGDLVFCSGQLGLDPLGGKLAAGARAQAERCLLNLRAVLAAESLGLDDVLKTTIYLADMGDFAEVNEAYASFFAAPFPARSTVQVAALPKGGLVEIEAIASR